MLISRPTQLFVFPGFDLSFLIGIGFKLSFVPMHFWVPDNLRRRANTHSRIFVNSA